MAITARTWTAIGGGVAALLAGAGALYVWFEKASEKPAHRLVEREGMFELRDYPDLLVAETVVPGNRGDALNRGFGKLADYIFAKKRSGEKIAMTAPVLSDGTASGEWRTRFVMPAKFSARTIPVPANDVAIATIAARRVAVLRFSSGSGDAVLADCETALRSWIATRGIAPTGPVEYAFYNSPYVPAPLRRNEVILPVSA